MFKFRKGKRWGGNMFPKASEDVVWKKNNEKIVLFDARSGKLFELSETAACIWELCNGKNTEDDIVSILAKEFNKDEADIRGDILEFMEEMCKKGFLDKNT